MKFATLRDGQPILVSRDLRWGTTLGIQCASLIEVLQRWHQVKHGLHHRYDTLNSGSHSDRFEFDPLSALSPFPKPAQWLDGSTFENHGRLMEKAFNLPPADYTRNPMMYQGNADDVVAPNDDVRLPSENDGMDFEGIGQCFGPTRRPGYVADDTPSRSRDKLPVDERSVDPACNVA
jgi:fumarylacetoacetate (FAA) hydrolase